MKLSRIFFVFLSLIVFFTSCKTPQQSIDNHNNRNNNNSSSFYKPYSDKLGVKFSGDEDKKLISCLAGWLGTPYKYGGSSKQGTDCSGMVFSVFDEVYHIKMYRSSYDQIKNVKQIDKNELKAGDLVFFKISGERISHVGIYLGDHKFIHASTKRGVVVNSLDEEYYKKYYFVSGRVITKPQN